MIYNLVKYAYIISFVLGFVTKCHLRYANQKVNLINCDIILFVRIIENLNLCYENVKPKKNKSFNF